VLNVLSLFTGVGGIDLGLERAGMRVVGQVEIDPYCQQVLAKHWPAVPRHDDVHTAATWWLSQERPRVDLIAGGFPCQPVSLAGRQRGQDDERWLWPAMADVIRQLRPGWLLLENVPGLLVRGLGDVLGDLAACGYDTEWDCVPASAVGAPHRRDRVWIVAYPTGDGRGTRGPGRSAGAGADGAGLAPEELADSNGDEHQGRAPALGRPAAQVVPADADRAARRPEARQPITGVGARPVPGGPAEPGGRGCDVADTDRVGRHRRPRIFQAAGPGGRVPAEGDGSWWAAEPDVGRVAHGIPGRVDRLRALGNSVVPQVVEHVGRLIVAAHQREVSPC
jgi:DNA (cytosine-5)-methyltransferase 1